MMMKTGATFAGLLAAASAGSLKDIKHVVLVGAEKDALLM